MGNIQTVGPNEALIVSGGCCRPTSKQIIVGGWCWSTWMLTNIQRLSLQVMTLNPKCEHVQSCHGVPVTVTGVVHCKIMSTPEFLPLAAEQFLGKSIDHIRSVILHTVEGHMRAVIGTQTIEDICKKRQELASMIREATTKDLSRMGIDILSLTIKEIKDDVEYLNSSGKRSTALVKRDAAVSAAKAESEASQVEAKCEREKREREIQKETKLASLKHSLEMAKASCHENVGRMQAEAEKAYDLQISFLQKDIKAMEMEKESANIDGFIEIQKIENERKKTELEMEIQLPARAEIYKLKRETEAYMAKQNAHLEAEEFRIKEEGEAEAMARRITGMAEAKGLKLIAEARKEFNEAAVLSETLKVLPQIAAELAGPLIKFDEIVLLSDGKTATTTASNEKKDAATDKSSTTVTTMMSGGKTPFGSATEAAKFASALPRAVQAAGGDFGSHLIATLMHMPMPAPKVYQS